MSDCGEKVEVVAEADEIIDAVQIDDDEESPSSIQDAKRLLFTNEVCFVGVQL